MSDLSVEQDEGSEAEPEVEEETKAEEQTDTEHLDAIPDGAGCVEIWEKIDEMRDD